MWILITTGIKMKPKGPSFVLNTRRQHSRPFQTKIKTRQANQTCFETFDMMVHIQLNRKGPQGNNQSTSDMMDLHLILDFWMTL